MNIVRVSTRSLHYFYLKHPKAIYRFMSMSICIYAGAACVGISIHLSLKQQENEAKFFGAKKSSCDHVTCKHTAPRQHLLFDSTISVYQRANRHECRSSTFERRKNKILEKKNMRKRARCSILCMAAHHRQQRVNE